jgi:hypothetical protein
MVLLTRLTRQTGIYLSVTNTGFNDCGKLVIQVARNSILMKIDLVRK